MQSAPSDTSSESAANLAAAGLALFTGALLLTTLGSVRYTDNPDEAYYLAYAGHLREHGLGSFRQLFGDYLAEPARWLYPNPLRLGHILLATGWTGLRGVSFAALSELSLFCHILLIGASYLFFRGLQGPQRALAGAALVAFSPLLLGLARRALADTPATLAGVLVLWSFCASLRRPERRGLTVLFACAFGAGMLVKETTVLLALPCAALWLYERFAARRSLPLLSYACAFAAPLAVCALLWWLAAGDAATVAGVARIILVSPTSNLYALEFGAGPWYRYAIDLLLLSPWPTLLGIAALGPAAMRLRQRAPGDAAVWLALLVVGILAAYAPFTRNVRYVALCVVPLSALAAGLVFELAAADQSRRGRFAALALIALLCGAGWLSFQALFVDAALYDPVTASLLLLRGFSAPP